MKSRSLNCPPRYHSLSWYYKVWSRKHRKQSVISRIKVESIFTDAASNNSCWDWESSRSGLDFRPMREQGPDTRSCRRYWKGDYQYWAQQAEQCWHKIWAVRRRERERDASRNLGLTPGELRVTCPKMHVTLLLVFFDLNIGHLRFMPIFLSTIDI